MKTGLERNRVTKDEARDYLESLDFCLKHLVRQERIGRKLLCQECEAERMAVEGMKIERAIAVLRGSGVTPPPANSADWVPCKLGSLPKANQRVWLAVKGMLEPNRPGGDRKRK